MERDWRQITATTRRGRARAVGAKVTTGHVFIATSLDGFIARVDGAIDWLLERDAEGEDHGYDAFIARIDAFVMGRGSYGTVAAFDPWPYPKPVIVLSRTLAGTAVPERLEGRVRFAATDPGETMRQLEAEGAARVYVDGGQVVQSFLRAGLIEDIVLRPDPGAAGRGTAAVRGDRAGDALDHVSTRAFPSGLVQSLYRVAG